MTPAREPSDDLDVIELGESRTALPQRLAVSDRGMVASQHHLATRAGAEMLEEGGNAVDAAVAAALALAVCEPNASGLGGQTMVLLYDSSRRRTIAVDGSSRAPNRAVPGTLSRGDIQTGYRATTVPSTPRVLSYLLSRYGSLPWARVLEPATRMASEGIEITPLQRSLLRRARRKLEKSTAAPIFLKEGKKLYRVGERFRQPAIAATLQRLAEKGVKDFYRGQIASRIHSDMIEHGGLIRKDDLYATDWPIERRPVSCEFDGKRLVTFPPPGAGRTLVEMLNIISALPQKYRNLDSPQGVLMIAKVIRKAFRDRTDRPFDPSYYAQLSNKKMLSVDYARSIAARIKSGGETTHLSVMDSLGNAVALTQSIERIYGACVATPELGFLYNNYLMAFEHEDIRHPYYLRPNGIPWASVAPTIVFNNRKPWLVIGSPGSERITSSILQVLLRLKKQSPLDAVDAPRFHCSIGDKVALEASRMRDDIPRLLEQQGFELDVRDPYSFYLGCVQMVLHDRGIFTGVADPRRDGGAGGPTG